MTSNTSPDGVLQQLEDHLGNLSPVEYIPVVLLLRACGWRISDILNLKFDKCLDRTGQGWYLCGDIVKTQVLNHRVPITDQLALVVQAVVEEVKQKSTFDNNPNKLLFVRFSGRRKGHCLKGDSIRDALNRLARQQNIVDDQGAVFHFGNHAFRHYGECWGMGSKLLSSCVLALLVVNRSPFYFLVILLIDRKRRMIT